MDISDIWDFITDKFSEAGEEIGNIFSGFSNLSEFSPSGLVGGILAAGIIIIFKKRMFDPFMIYSSASKSFFLFILTVILAFGLGYVTVKGIMEN